MKSIVKPVLSQTENIKKASSVYIDNLYITENIASVNHITGYLWCFGLTSKNLECQKLGLGYLAWLSGERIVPYDRNVAVRFQAALKWSPEERCSLFVPDLSDTFQYVDGCL